MDRWKIKTYLRKYFATILLLVFYLSEAFSKYAIFYEGGKSEIPRAIKLAALLIVFVSIVKPWKNILYPAILLTIFIVGQLFLSTGFNLEIVVSFSKFLFPILLFIYFNEHPQSDPAMKTLFAAFEWLLVFNSTLLFLGLIAHFYLLQSYQGPRFGYNGLFITTAPAPTFIRLPYFIFW